MRFLTVMVPAAAIVIALTLPAVAQSSAGTQQGRTPQKAAPVQRGPAAGPRTSMQPGRQNAPVGRPGYAGHPGYAGRPEGRRIEGRRPDFMRRSYAGHYYRGSLAWERGRWRHEWRNGRYGWWWDVGGAWYFYEQPTEGPPAFISEVEIMDDPDAMAVEGPPPDAPVAVEAYPPPPAVVYPPPAVIVAPPPVVCVGPLCIR